MMNTSPTPMIDYTSRRPTRWPRFFTVAYDGIGVTAVRFVEGHDVGLVLRASCRKMQRKLDVGTQVHSMVAPFYSGMLVLNSYASAFRVPSVNDSRMEYICREITAVGGGTLFNGR
jgi:hypothetical protein